MYLQAYLGVPYADGALPSSEHESHDIGVVLESVEIQVVRRPVAGYARTEPSTAAGVPRIEIPKQHPARVLAQDILSREWLDWDLPLSGVEITHTLSGATTINGTLAPEIQSLEDLGLEPWGTFIHVEEAGQIRASGILQPVEIDAEAESLTLSAVGFSDYPSKIPYLGEYSKENVDPWEIVQEIWRHLQSYPDGELGVIVDPGETGVKIGNEKEDEKDENSKVKPYELMWWNHTDCAQEIDDLSRDTPFEYVERTYWNSDRTDVEHHLVLGAPRYGTRRRDLRIAQGENLLTAVTAAEPSDIYASQVVVTGSGEGKEMIRGSKSTRYANRLRRVTLVEDKTIDKKERADSLADETLRYAQAALTEIAEVEIDARHENAKLGSFGVGDELLIGPVDIPYRGTLNLWHRVTSYTYTLDGDSIRLTLSRKDAVRGDIS